MLFLNIFYDILYILNIIHYTVLYNIKYIFGSKYSFGSTCMMYIYNTFDYPEIRLRNRMNDVYVFSVDYSRCP
uniref:Uncharacterized protein n=1 Tax=Anguilla anguilla TaxID=7936 RepID=A0A0E9U5Q3_ANGAN